MICSIPCPSFLPTFRIQIAKSPNIFSAPLQASLPLMPGIGSWWREGVKTPQISEFSVRDTLLVVLHKAIFLCLELAFCLTFEVKCQKCSLSIPYSIFCLDSLPHTCVSRETRVFLYNYHHSKNVKGIFLLLPVFFWTTVPLWCVISAFISHLLLASQCNLLWS